MRKSYLFLVFLFLLLAIPLNSQLNTLQELYTKGKQAYEAGDYLTFLNLTEEALKIHPSQPTLLYNQAAGLALSGKKDKALARLAYLLSWNASLSIDEDTDFTVLVEDKHTLQKISKKKIKYNSILQRSEKEITVYGKYHLEDLYIIKDKLFATDVHHGKFLVIDISSGKVQSVHNLAGSGMAIAYNSSANTLWISSAMMPQFNEYVEEENNTGILYEYYVATNEITHQFTLPEPAIIGSMVIHGGKLYASNSIKPEILVVNPTTHKINQTIKLAGAFSLQGVTVDKENNCLYVADYIRGIVRVNLDNENDRVWCPSPDYLLKGIDGLTLIDSHTLVGIQNNSTPKRVVRIVLSKDFEVEKVDLLDNGIFGEAEPTNGRLLSGGFFYFIGNSPWPFYDQDGKADQSKWAFPEIRMIKF